MTSPTPSSGHPLVSFIVYAFQQEGYIEEAIAGALSQTYPNLEIILSDDCSKDLTFEIMQGTAKEYRGPHRVRARRNASNLGLWGHFLAAINDSHGDLVVVAAGDDISLPQRVTRLVEEWQASGASALTSAWVEIDDRSKPLGTGVKHPVAPGNVVWQYFEHKHDRPFISGQAAAYDRRFLERLPTTQARIFHEDSLLTMLATAWGLPIAIVPEPLIEYRVHPASYSKQLLDSTGFERTLAEVLRTARYAEANASYLRYAMEILRQDPPASSSGAAIDWANVENILALRAIETAWVSHGLGDRLRLVMNAPNTKLRLLAAQRLLPMPLFAGLKHLVR